MNSNKSKLLILIVCIFIALIILITYKITNQQIFIPKPEIQEYPVSSSEYIKQQHKILENLKNNFNSKELINKYFDKKTNIKAVVKGNTIDVYYRTDEAFELFSFVLDNDNISTSVSIDKLEKFINIFKMMIESNQKRLGNDVDLTDYFDKYINDDFISEAVVISKNEDIVEYTINIDEKINY